MADTMFIDGTTTVVASWLNDVNDATYTTVPAHTSTLASGVVLKDSSTGGAQIPSGTTAQRPGAPVGTLLRYNTTISNWEGYNGSVWGLLASGFASSGPNNDITSLTGLVGNGLLPIGSVIFHAANSAPTGYLKANGALVSRTTYAGLFAVIGTTFGVGDGSTTFGLPDFRGEFVRGWDDGRGIDVGRPLGSAQLDTLQGHQHTYTYPETAYIRAGSNGDSPYTPGTRTTAAIVSDGTNGAPRISPETRPRNVALLACIKF